MRPPLNIFQFRDPFSRCHSLQTAESFLILFICIFSHHDHNVEQVITYRKGRADMNDQEMKNEGNTEPEPVPDTPDPAPQEHGTEPQPSGTPVEEPLGEPAVALMEDMEEGKTFAILSYALGIIGLPFFIVPLIQRNNAFSLFHAKQCLVLWIVAVAGSVISSVLIALCIGAILLPIVLIFFLVLDIIGLMNALKGVAKPLPLIGQWGIDWFKGMTKI